MASSRVCGCREENEAGVEAGWAGLWRGRKKAVEWTTGAEVAGGTRRRQKEAAEKREGAARQARGQRQVPVRGSSCRLGSLNTVRLPSHRLPSLQQHRRRRRLCFFS